MVVGVVGVDDRLPYGLVLRSYVVEVVNVGDTGLTGAKLGIANEARGGAENTAGPDVVRGLRRNNRDGTLGFERVDSIFNVVVECVNDFGASARDDEARN